MLSFTLDTNCIIALEEGRADAATVRAIVDAHVRGIAHVAIAAISASEKQKDGSYLENFIQFQNRLKSLGLEHLELLRPPLYLDISYSDWCIFSSEETELLEKKIHEILFPNIEFRWRDYCAARDLDVSDNTHVQKWRNAKCDVLALWCHINSRRDVFVTADNNFLKATKKDKLLGLGVNRVETPSSAVLLLDYKLGQTVSP